MRDQETLAGLFHDVAEESERIDKRWGWPRGFGAGTIPPNRESLLASFWGYCEAANDMHPDAGPSLEDDRRWAGVGGWSTILGEEFCEAVFADTDEDREKELIQVAAVALSWAQQIRERKLQLELKAATGGEA